VGNFSSTWGPSRLLWTAPRVNQHVFLTNFTWGKGLLTSFWYKAEETEVSLGMVKLKTKHKVHPLTSHEGPEEYCSTLSSTSVLDVGWMVNATPWSLYLQEINVMPMVHMTGRPQGLSERPWKSLALVGVQILYHPAHSQSLCWLHCPGPSLGMVANIWLTAGNWP
jgi:hypothetical protein